MFLFVKLLLSSFVWANEGVSFRIHHQYQSPRALGMGDAFVAVANDYNAILYNPAGLARLDDGELNLFLGGAISSSFQKTLSDIQNAQATTGTQQQKELAVMTVLQEQYGNTFGGRGTLFSGFYARPNWGVALIPLDFTIEGTLRQAVGPAINTTVYADTTLAFGYGDAIKSLKSWGDISWGVTAKAINRGYFSKAINFVELATDPNVVKTSDLKEGFGIDGDLGFLYSPRLPTSGLFSLLKYTRPTFGLVVRNIAETKFSSNPLKLYNKQGTSTPEKLYRVIDIGTRWEYPSFWLFGGRGVLDIRDLMHPAISSRKSLHLGFEFDWTVASWWKGNYRFGLNQGYLTAGVSMMFAVFNLDLVTYAEDVGTANTPMENRNYALRMNFNW